MLPEALFADIHLGKQQLAYGEEQGDHAFRQSLARFLFEDYQHVVSHDELMITNGASNGLDMICTQFARQGDVVLVEDPTYFIARKQFADHGLSVKAVPMDEQGIQLDVLEGMIRQYKPAFIYTIPSFQNPSGVTMPEHRRKKLVQLVQQLGCMLVADEVYQSLYFNTRPPLPLACYDNVGVVISLGSFSKILAPGLRLGWMQAKKTLLDTFIHGGLLDSGGGLAPVSSAIVKPLIDNGSFKAYLDNLRQVYSSRSAVLAESLVDALGDKIHFREPDGGYFIWASLNSGRDARALLEDAKAEGLSWFGGNLFTDGNAFDHCMRFCFAHYPEQTLCEACERLSRVFRKA